MLKVTDLQVSYGAINALAGGGMFMVFPALLLAGVAPVAANATSTLTLLPGGWASTWVYRDRLAQHGWRLVRGMALASLLGGYAGSELLLHTSNSQFAMLVPWLMLGAVLLLFANAFGAVATAYALTGSSLTIVPIMLYAQIRGDVLHNPNLGYAMALGMIVITGLANAGYMVLRSKIDRRSA